MLRLKIAAIFVDTFAAVSFTTAELADDALEIGEFIELI